jgi:small redox-active disulfide protein 2
MKDIKILGTGCTKCIKTAEVISTIAKELNIDINIAKITDPETIMNYGVMSTPAVIIDEVNVHAGSIPHKDAITTWLKTA